MKNYINLNGKKIVLTDEQVSEIQKSFGIGQVKLSAVKAGDTFKIGKYEFIVLEQSGDTTAVILKNLLYENNSFGKNNNYNGSYVDKICSDFAKDIGFIIGMQNIIEHTVDLTSDDGLKDYGKIKREMSLLTADLYRRYVSILDKHKLDNYWWLATACSTPTHSNSFWITCVCPSGIICSSNCFSNYGVRPFCILNSNIFVSK